MNVPLVLAVSIFCVFETAALAASLQVSPVLLEVPAPGAAATVTVRNSDVQPITAQIRVFRWTQAAGEERLEATDDVVASPPIVELRSRQDYTVRIIRVAGRPVAREEAYRLVIDELPKPQQRSGTVALVLRHVVPLFFNAREASPGAVAWTVTRQGNAIALTAANAGDSRVRLASVDIRDAAGRQIPVSKGLLGYALGRSSMRWMVPLSPRGLSAGAKVTITGSAETGRFNATSIVQAAR